MFFSCLNSASSVAYVVNRQRWGRRSRDFRLLRYRAIELHRYKCSPPKPQVFLSSFISHSSIYRYILLYTYIHTYIYKSTRRLWSRIVGTRRKFLTESVRVFECRQHGASNQLTSRTESRRKKKNWMTRISATIDENEQS